MFVKSEDRGKVRHDVPVIDDTIADVEAGIEEADVIGMADARLGPGVNSGLKVGGDVIEEIGSSQSAECAAETVPGDEQVFAIGGFGLNQPADVVTHRFVDDLKAGMNCAAAGDRAVGFRSEIEIVEPVLEIFGAAEGDDQPAVFGVDAEPAKVQVWFDAARHRLH